MNADFQTADRPLVRADELKKTRRRRRIFLPLLVLAIAIAGFAVLSAQREAPDKTPVEDKALLVSAQPVSIESMHLMVDSQGTVAPRTQTNLVAEVAGKITWVAQEFLAGGFFEQGEILLQIDPSDYEVALKRAESTLASNQAKLASEQARADQARKDWEKLEGRRGQQPPELVLRVPQLAEAKAAVSFAEADVDKARRDLERTRIRAPYAALVRAKSADLGQFVNVGAALGQIAAVDRVEVRLPVTSEDMDFLFPEGAALTTARAVPVELTAEVGGRRLDWKGQVVRAEGVINERTRMQYLVAQVSDPYALQEETDGMPLQIGQFVRARIQGMKLDRVVTIPRHLLRSDGTVLTTGADRRLHIATVDVLREDADHAYLSGGLEENAQLITTGIDFPVEGMVVRLRGDEEKALAGSPAAGAPMDLVAEGGQ